MSQYVALYRKYRPGTFAELVGQEAVARTLTRAIEQERLAHAYLFCGPRGTGKTSVARILAKALNCASGPTPAPCGACASCRAISAGSHLDVLEIDAASNNGVDNIRDLQDRVALAPVTGRTKVYIIDEVHMLSQGAFNALLKTLEEPPPRVVFVLATTDAHKVLPTIVSRCQRFDFGRIPFEALMKRLREVSAAEGLSVSEPALELVSRKAQGGLRDALSLLDQLSAMALGQEVTGELAARMLGLVESQAVAELAGALVDADAGKALALARDMAAEGLDESRLARELLTHFRHVLVVQLAPEAAARLEVPPTALAALTAQAEALSRETLGWFMDRLADTDRLIRQSPQGAIWLELGLLQLALRPAIPTLAELTERVAALEAALAGGAALPPPPAAPSRRPSAPAATAPPAPPAAAPSAAAAWAPALPPPSAPAAEPPTAASGWGAPAPAAPAPAASDWAVSRSLPEAPAAAPAAPPAAPAPAPVRASGGAWPVGVSQPVWEQLIAALRAKSVPTAALVSQQAALLSVESDGAVRLCLGKAFKDMFEKQPSKKQLLLEAIVAIFGAGAYPRLEVGDPKAAPPLPATAASGGWAPAPAALPPRPAPAAPAPASAPRPAPPPAAAFPPPPSFDPPPFDDDIPPPEPPGDWDTRFESSYSPTPEELAADAGAPRPVAPPAAAPGRPPAAGRPPGPAGADPAGARVQEIFNGRVIRPLEGGPG